MTSTVEAYKMAKPSSVPDRIMRRVSEPLLATWTLLSGDGDIDLKVERCRLTAAP
jgi:hypothetical protein